MRVLCSQCHTAFRIEPEDEHPECPNCKAEAGLEPIKDETPNAMKYFGSVLLVVGMLVVVGSLIGLVS